MTAADLSGPAIAGIVVACCVLYIGAASLLGRFLRRRGGGR
jgi:hypothetical protein